MKDAFLYKITRPIITFLFKLFFRPKIVGIENIPKDGKIILAGNHTNNLDCLLLISSTKRNIHFLAKKELWDGFKGIIFSHMGLIPVDRSIHSSEPLKMAEKYLDNGLCVLIFPEGTTEKKGDMLPFKIGTVKLAKDTNTLVVPFIIKGEYKLFSKDLTIKFLKPIEIKGNFDEENNRLYNIIRIERDERI